MRYFQSFESVYSINTLPNDKNKDRSKKVINFANFTTFFNISEARLPTSTSLCQVGHILYNSEAILL